MRDQLPEISSETRGSSAELEQGVRTRRTGTEKILESSRVETGGRLDFDNQTLEETAESFSTLAEKKRRRLWRMSSGRGLVEDE